MSRNRVARLLILTALFALGGCVYAQPGYYPPAYAYGPPVVVVGGGWGWGWHGGGWHGGWR